MRHERTIGSKGHGLWGMKGEQLPAYIQHVYNDLVEGGEPTGSETYRKAVGIVENWAEGHDGKGNKVSADTQAKAVAAIAEWNKLRAKAHAVKEAILEAASAGDGDVSKGDSGQPMTYCVRCKKKVRPTRDKKCPDCGADLSKAMKVREAVSDVLESQMSAADRKKLSKSDFAIPEDRAYPIHDIGHARNALARCSGKPEEGRVKAAVYKRYPTLKPKGGKVQEAVRHAVLEASSSSASMSNLPRRPGESLGSWGTRLKAADAALAARQSKSSRTRSGGSASSFNKQHPRGRGGQWIFKQGSSGGETKAIQSKLGASVDGQYGSQTKAAVERFQRQHGLKVDGEVGAQTVAAMRGQKNAAKVTPGAMSATDRAWLLRQVVKRGH